MAIDDKLHAQLLGALKAFMGCGRTKYVESALYALACDILRHLGYEVIKIDDPDKPKTL